MKKVFKILMICLFLSSLCKPARAEEEGFDMSIWSFKILLQHADQSDELKVVRFKNKDSGRDGFCMEPLVDYVPTGNVYVKEEVRDKAVFDIFRAYELLGEDYYIAAQLMIWENNTGVRYSFEGKDAADYGEADILETIKGFNDPIIEEEYTIDAIRNKENSITVKGLSDYEIESSGVQILSTENEQIKFQISEGNCDIILRSKKNIETGSYRYHSETSQDLFSYEGDYSPAKRIIYHLNGIDESFSVSFTKTDEGGRSLEGTVFSVYAIDEQGDREILLIKKGTPIDFNEVYQEEHSSVETSERYQRYFDGTYFQSEEIGFFPYSYGDHEGTAFVCNDDELVKTFQLLNARFIKDYVATDSEVQTIDDLDPDQTYLIAETKPLNGYEFSSDPLIKTDAQKAKEHVYSFVNHKRHYDLKLYKENEEHTILLDGARFSLTYEKDGEEKSYEFVTGALNIFKDEEGAYVLYRHESDENVYIGEFKGNSFIKENMRPGRYYYCISDDTNINNCSLYKSTEVSTGSFRIEDLPYDAKVTVRELKAPKGYFIDENEYELHADIDYSSLTFKNYRVNQFDIFANKRHKIPKTCIGS